jgi:tetratricopeptide (TPR) repeat protein
MPASGEQAAWVAAHLTYAGEPLTTAEVDGLERMLSDVAAQPADEAITTLTALVEAHPRVSASSARLVDALTDAGRVEEAQRACARAIAQVDRRDGWRALCRRQFMVLEESGDSDGCFQAALDLLERYPADWLAQMLVGNHLDDLDAHWGARNHLLIACAAAEASPGAHNILGVVYQKLGLLACAQRSFSLALAVDPHDQLALANLALNETLEPTHDLAYRTAAEIEGVGCTACPAMYDITDARPAACARCGVTRPIAGACPMCGADGVVVPIEGLPVPFRCPTCRRGNLERRSTFEL